MRPAISYEAVKTKEQWNELRAFAASFGHTVSDATRTPMFLVRRGEKLFGYFSVSPYPTLYPCFHPDHTTSRDFVEAVEQIRAWQQLMSSGSERYPRGICQFAFGDSNNETRKALERMGCHKVAEIWEAVP